MCQHKSGIAVKRSETEITVYFLKQEDSHQKIRNHFGLNDKSPLSRYQTPIEFIPVRGCETIDQYDFKFDDSRPEWWTDEMTEEAKRVLFGASQIDIRGEWKGGSADFRSLTDAKGLSGLTSIGGYADFRSLTDAKGLSGLTSIGGPAYFTSLMDANGLSGLTSIGGYAYFSSLTEDRKSVV